MLDSGALLEKHRSKGVLVDSNLLVLLVVGQLNRRRIADFKRTENFTTDDFDTLSQLVEWFGSIVTTPHVLSQVSDLTDLRGRELTDGRRIFKLAVEKMNEHYEQSLALVRDPLLARLGLADVAIANVCAKGVVVLTSDLQLYLALEGRGIDAINFNHIRAMKWGLRS